MSVVGKRVARAEGSERVKGAGLFADDYKYFGMLHAAVVRSPLARCEIRKIDFKTIAKIPGVAGVLTHKDIPGLNCVPIVIDDQPFLAERYVNYIGEPIAIVVAENRQTARLAAAQAKISIEELPPLLNPLEALNHPKIHLFGNDNIYKHIHIHRGDVKKAFADCDVIIENEYHTPYQEHAYIEPQSMIAIPLPDGSIEIRGSMQCPFYVRKAITTILGLPENKVRVIQCATGGGFGGKEDVPSLLACQVALPAWIFKRPVKLIYDRTEDMMVTSKRHPAYIKYKSGATKDGILRAVEAEYIIDGGAYSTLSAVVLFRGSVHAIGPYKCENVDVHSYAVATNKVPTGAFRGFGSPQILFAVESQMDQLAEKIGMDPVMFRKKNILRVGDTTVTGQKLEYSVGLEETLDKVIEKSGWTPGKSKEDGVGYGISTIYYGVGLGAGGKSMARTGARVLVHADGSVLFSVGTTEIGQGMTTVLSQIVADELGAPLDWISMMPTDTSRVPDSGPTVASRSTTMSGNALKDACIKIKSVLLEEAASMLDCSTGDIIFDEGIVTGGGKTIKLLDVIKSCFAKRLPLSAEGWYITPSTSWDDNTGQGDAYVVYAWASNLAKVKVDKETGEVNLLKIWAAHDVGKAINPALAEGQIEGGTLQGVGYALMEDMTTNADGAIRNPEFSTYIIPTASDQPEIVPIIVEHPFPGGPFGAKGFGEQPLMGVAPAIANAVYDAVKVRIKDLPITPEKVWQGLKNK
jgi:CO/xanthine dehydrogenase Mo-binding subunit